MKKLNGSTTDLAQIIGIIPIKSASDDVYTQLLAIAIANYITAVRHRTVALINMSDTSIFENLAWYYNISFCSDDRYFKLHDVIYYPHYDEKYLSGNITDYSIFIGRAAFEKAGLKLVAGSLAPWEMKNYADFLKRMSVLYSKHGDTWHFMAQCFSEKDKKILEKKFNISILQPPADLNPFKLKLSDFHFFNEILS